MDRPPVYSDCAVFIFIVSSFVRSLAVSYKWVTQALKQQECVTLSQNHGLSSLYCRKLAIYVTDFFSKSLSDVSPFIDTSGICSSVKDAASVVVDDIVVDVVLVEVEGTVGSSVFCRRGA
ncbi:hypothetical protein OUZ56_016339 [Daphnia magna]|uniref:Uncharacterized protein n=1 Tax=Daphnia magna TaxID=35525 RepID=A0ABR0AQC6_9CRUS|nr:hypothetical protein OUZ56_016339 [Daphnia magna]